MVVSSSTSSKRKKKKVNKKKTTSAQGGVSKKKGKQAVVVLTATGKEDYFRGQVFPLRWDRSLEAQLQGLLRVSEDGAWRCFNFRYFSY